MKTNGETVQVNMLRYLININIMIKRQHFARQHGYHVKVSSLWNLSAFPLMYAKKISSEFRTKMAISQQSAKQMKVDVFIFHAFDVNYT